MGSPDFEPKRHIITAITNSMNAAVTTLAAHGYSSDDVVCLIVPLTAGMRLNYVETKIAVTGATTFTCDLDTQAMDVFVVPITGTPPHVCPVSASIENVAT